MKTIKVAFVAMMLGMFSLGCNGGTEDESTTPTDETYTTSGGEDTADEDDPPEPTFEDPN